MLVKLTQYAVTEVASQTVRRTEESRRVCTSEAVRRVEQPATVDAAVVGLTVMMLAADLLLTTVSTMTLLHLDCG